MRSRVITALAAAGLVALLAAASTNNILQVIPTNWDGGVLTQAVSGTVIVTSRDGGLPSVVVNGVAAVAGEVIITSRDGSVPYVNSQSTWTVDSNACIAASVTAATGGEDGGRLKSADGGIAEAGKLYRCFNPSGSVGDICLRSNSTTPFACSASALSMAVAPGGEAWTMLTDPVMVTSSSGAASLICCPTVF